MEYKSRLISLAEIVGQEEAWTFTVPIYQRLYVWGDDQVGTLLNDLVNAYERDEKIFFLGGTLVVERESKVGKRFELIDGQQRFTTLWMLCHAWRAELEPFLTVKEGTKIEPRLSFAIRPKVNAFLKSLIFTSSESEEDGARETRRMREAIASMNSLFQTRPLPDGISRKEHVVGLSEFIYKQVKLVLTTVPIRTDLNKLFEVINNRGVQLQHHEILKARMLDVLEDHERRPFAILWESCADMEEFVERGLAGNSQLLAKQVAGLCKKNLMTRDGESLANAEAVLSALRRSEKEETRLDELGLKQLLEGVADDKAAVGKSEAPSEREGTTWVRSIIGFPMFLQHVLRIWLHREGLEDLPRILDRELLSLFEEHFFKDIDETGRSERTRSFIKLLWELRYRFDKHCIKWVNRGEEEVHMISRLDLSTSGNELSLSRSKESEANQGFGLLQSMLYHSQEITTHYWITPLLNYIHLNPGSSDDYYRYLRHLDTYLLGSKAEGNLATRTLAFLKQPWLRHKLNHIEELRKTAGVDFRHYWFYKMDYVLWYLKHQKESKWASFRFTAKNSVEHISPQNPVKQDDNRAAGMLHRFGNLALVSRSLNSEYSNLPFNEKRQRFINNNKSKLDSVKMDMIYRNKIWSDEIALKHENDMIGYMDEYVDMLADKSIP